MTSFHSKALLGLSGSIAALTVATAAYAQEVQPQAPEAEAPAPDNADQAASSDPAPSDDGSEIVVTGFRASLSSAINQRRLSNAAIDAIQAEDIADFPDLNLAESLQRIPGVAISRVNGEGRNISVRGLGPEYTRVRLNGMEAIGTTGGTDNSGGVNRGRGFDFNIFSSELFSNLTVRKTASADVEEGSLGGTVDLRSVRPLDYREPTVVLSAQASYNDLSEQVTPRFTGLVATQSADGRFGALISVAYEERRIIEEGANITRWTYGGFNGGFSPLSTIPGYTIGQINNTNPETALYHPRIPGLVSYDINQQRLGAALSFQFRPVEGTTFSLDGIYSRLEGTRQESQLQAISFSRSGTGKPQTIIRNAVVDENNNIISGTFDNVDLRSQSRFDRLVTDFYQVTGSVDHEFSDRLKIGLLGGYSRSEFSNPIQTTVTIDAPNTANFQYDFSTRFPTIRPGVDVSNPATWSFLNGTSEVRIRPQTVTNAFTTARGFIEWKADPSLTFRGGLDWRRFEYGSTEQRRLSGETVVAPLTAAQLAPLLTQFTGFGRNLNVPNGTLTGWAVPNLEAFIRQAGIYTNPIYATGGIENATARGSFVTVTEENTGAWGMMDFNMEAFGLPIRGDVGVRYVRTDQISTGYASQGATINLVTAERSYERWLPSLNIVANITENLQVRFGASKTLARAGIASLSPGGNLNVSGGNRSFSSGNPDLQPTSSNNLDLAVEWYPTPGAIYAVSLFRKDIGTFVQNLSVDVPFNQLGLPASLLTGTTASPTDVFIVSQPVNSNGGILQGFEVNVQQPLSFLPGFLSNFGVILNYTFVESDIEYLTNAAGTASVTAPLIGLSRNAANGTLYYETERFSIRGSVAYRDRYLTAVPGTEGNAYNGTSSTLNVDAQISYNLTDRIRLSLEMINLTDQVNDQFVDETNRLNVLTHSGRQFIFGVRWAL